MHDGMPYDPIQGQGQGHGTSKVQKIALFQNNISSAIYVTSTISHDLHVSCLSVVRIECVSKSFVTYF